MKPERLFAMMIDEKPIPGSRPRVTRWGTYYPKTTQAYMDLVDGLVREVWGNKPPLTGEVTARVFVAGGRVNADLDNHAKLVLDSLVRAGVLEHDDVRTVRKLVVQYAPAASADAYTWVQLDRYEAAVDDVPRAV